MEPQDITLSRRRKIQLAFALLVVSAIAYYFLDILLTRVEGTSVEKHRDNLGRIQSAPADESRAKQRMGRTSQQNQNDVVNLDAPKGIFVSALRQWELDHHQVLRSTEDGDGNQAIVIAIPAPPEDYVSQNINSALLGMPIQEKSTARSLLLNDFADYTGFTSSTYAKDYWGLAGKQASYRILYINFSDNKSVLTVTFTDTADPPDIFWREGRERALTTEIESHGRMTPQEAADRFGHLFEIEGIMELSSAEGSPERAREMKERKKRSDSEEHE